MKVTRDKYYIQAGGVSLLLAVLFWFVSPALAKDTDIYAVNAKSNCYLLMDSSGSMAWPLYESSIDYGAMFNYLFTLNDNPVGDYPDYIYDPVNFAAYYQHHKPVNQIYLMKTTTGVKVNISTVGGQPVAFTGDTGNTSLAWDRTTIVDTHTIIDSTGNLSHDGGPDPARLTVVSGHVRLDNVTLPMGMDVLQHDNVTLGDGSVIDNGFVGQLDAPGIYFSGYEGVALGALNPVEDNDTNTYFFVTGNWVNFKAMLGLKYNGVNGNDYAWKYETYLIDPVSWSVVNTVIDYPVGTGNYLPNKSEADTVQTITHPGAKKIQVHFSSFDVQGNGNVSTFTKDYVKIYNSVGAVVDQYDNDLKPTSINGGWSSEISGDTVVVKLKSDGSINGTGYYIDKIRVVYDATAGGAYLTQSRTDAAKEAMIYAVDELRGKINWGLFSFDISGNANGATPLRLINPTETDSVQRADMISKISSVPASGGTPLMEALQDVWKKGYYDLKDSATGFKNSLCSNNYIISMTDGFPSVDYDNKRITVGTTTVTFADWDGDGWTMDPTQSTDPDYYDDVANWMYKKSWRTFNTNVADPTASYENVTTHHISFGAKHPLLGDAANGKATDPAPKGSGGSYIAVNNKAQMISAFYSLGLAMSKSISFTAPVVSVDANNKIQNGDDLYMGLFLPENNTYWVGNLKKFKLGQGENRFKIYGNDAFNHEVQATNTNGEFINTVDDLWDNDDDSNGAADIKDDGAGEVLLEDVTSFFAAGATSASAFWNRPIYTYKTGIGMVKFNRNNITATDLGVADNATRDKLVNFIHGYTYDANVTTGAPLAVRDWILGPIVHSRPVVVEYYNTTLTSLPLLKRLVVVGSNDGMLHVFDDTIGREVFAFIPPDILTKLQTVQSTLGLYDTVDGLITPYRRDKNPKYLIFGGRRGGGAFWNLDVSNQNPLLWTVAWNYTNAEISQSWSEVKVASLPVAIDTHGLKTYKDVAIFTGGYDTEEDFYPEPFTDLNSNGKMDAGEWVAATQDKNLNGFYDKYNPDKNEKGRGIFVVDIDNPATVTTVTTLASATPQQLLPFSVTYGATAVTTGVTQKLDTMKFSFPASPVVVTGTDKYTYYNTVTSKPEQVVKGNVLLALYAVDVYANLFKTQFALNLVNANPNGIPYWEANSAGWTVNQVFAGNPGSTSGSGRMGAGADLTDQGRKAFYPPTISWGGSKGKFEAGNYSFPNVTFNTRDTMASLFFGTGDRENPKYAMIRNRFYAIYDDSSVTAKLNTTPSSTIPTYTNVPVSSAPPVTSTPYYEDDLLNLTCDELGISSTINSCYLGNSLPDGTTCTATSADVNMKKYLNSLLTDNAVYGTTPALEYGMAHENDAKGWYITLEDQGNSTKCSHVTYFTNPISTTNSSHDNHVGEQILSQAILYYGNLYFTSYQPSTTDPCNPQGNGFTYALNYLDGSAAFDMNPDVTNVNYVEKKDITDRYNKYNGIVGIASGFSVITRDGHAAAWASVGSSLKGPGRDGDPEIPTAGLGLELFYWRDSNSQQP